MIRYITIYFSFVLFALCDEDSKNYKDSLMPFISDEQPIEDILIDAFIALPQSYFQGTVRQRALMTHYHATNPSVTLNAKAKTLRLEGDGGQATVVMTILEWHSDVLKVRVDYSRETTQFSETLVRTNYGWTKQKEKAKKENKAEKPTPHR